MTVTMNEAGMVELPPSVRKQFNLVAASRLELDVQEDGFTIRPVRSTDPEKGMPEPLAGVVRQGRLRVFTGGPVLSDEAIVQAIAADRDERAASIAGIAAVP